MNQEETIEIEIDGELLGAVKLTATKQGVTAEQYISEIVTNHVKAQESSPGGSLAASPPVNPT